MKLKYNVSNVCDDESLESEKGLEKKQKQKQKNPQAEEGKVEQGVTGMSLPRRRGKGEPGKAQGEFPPATGPKAAWGSRVKRFIF